MVGIKCALLGRKLMCDWLRSLIAEYCPLVHCIWETQRWTVPRAPSPLPFSRSFCALELFSRGAGSQRGRQFANFLHSDVIDIKNFFRWYIYTFQALVRPIARRPSRNCALGKGPARPPLEPPLLTLSWNMKNRTKQSGWWELSCNSSIQGTWCCNTSKVACLSWLKSITC